MAGHFPGQGSVTIQMNANLQLNKETAVEKSLKDFKTRTEGSPSKFISSQYQLHPSNSVERDELPNVSGLFAVKSESPNKHENSMFTRRKLDNRLISNNRQFPSVDNN